MSSGTYVIKIGSLLYVGSTVNLSRRKCDHQWRLRAGKHPVVAMQAEFNRCKEFSFLPQEFMRHGAKESEQDFRDRLKAAEQLLLDHHKENRELANRSMNARGPDKACHWWTISEVRRDEWVRKLSEAQKGRVFSEETKERMATAKKGHRNPKATPCRVWCPDGSATLFETVTAAAAFLGVTQQVLDLWLSGKVPWPGTGHKLRKKTAWLVPYRAELVPCDK